MFYDLMTDAVHTQCFQIGKYYKHDYDGEMMHVVSEGDTTFWGKVMIAEFAHKNKLLPVGTTPDHANGWHEISASTWNCAFEKNK